VKDGAVTKPQAARACLLSLAAVGLGMVGGGLTDNGHRVGWVIVVIAMALFAWFSATIRSFLVDRRWDKKE
jgi:hypothetical protein